MIKPDILKALRSIASMMRMEGYRPDVVGVEALFIDNAADEIEWLRKENGRLDSCNKELSYDNEQKFAELQRLLRLVGV